MDKTSLPNFLQNQHTAFLHAIRDLSDADFMVANNGKWTAGQQTEHIVRTLGPVASAFGLPAWALRLIFGKANRPSRTYEALVEKYQQKLVGGYQISSRFLPPPVPLEQRETLARQVEKQVKQLQRRLLGFSENQLDTLLLPHPLLGKLTLREMLYFAAYHVEHHHKQVQQNLKTLESQ